MSLIPLDLADVATWSARRDRIFSGLSPDEGLFRDSSWRWVIIDRGLESSAETLDALHRMASVVGDSHFVVMGHREEFDAQPAFILAWESGAVADVVTGSVLGHIDVVTFGESEKWARYSSPEGFSIVGADPKLVSIFVRAAGGFDAIRKQLERSLERGTIGFGSHAIEYVNSLISQVEWDTLAEDTS